MARIRKSRTDNRFFLDIPKEDEDEDKIKKKYKKTILDLEDEHRKT